MNDERENLFQILIEDSPNVVIRHGLDLRCVYANAAFFLACGQDPEALIGSLAQEWPLVFDVQCYEDHLRKTFQTGEPIALDLAWRTPDGLRRWSQIRFVPERDAAQQVVSVLSVSHDITAHKDLQVRLERAEQLAKIGFWEFDFKGESANISRQACEMAGFAPGTTTATMQELLDLYRPEERDWVVGINQAALAAHQKSLQYEYTWIRDGAPRHFQSLLEFEYSPQGEPLSLFAVSQDITENVRADELLRKHEQEFRVLMENTPDVVTRYDRNCRRIYANSMLSKLTGLPVSDLLGVTPTQAHDTPETQGYQHVLQQALSTGESQECRYRWGAKGMSDSTFHMRIVPERDADGQVVSVLAIGRDISAFEASERRLEDAQRIARICHWEWDYTTRRAFISPVGLEVLGFTGITSMSLSDFHAIVPIDERAAMDKLYKDAFAKGLSELRYEHSLMLPNGDRRETHNWVRIEYGPTGRAVRAIGVTQDVTDLKALQRQTHQLEFYDPLTNLPNRALLHDRLQLAMHEATRESSGVGLVLLDIDHFQKINDSLGNGAGDSLIRMVSERLSHALRDYDTVARMGGDEFAIIVPQIRQAADMDVVASRIKSVFASPIALHETEIFVTASAGIAMYPADGADVDELMSHADAAMYHAKSCGRDNFQFYARELTATALERLTIEADLRKAIERNELELFYQPQVDLSTGKVVSAEALMRWRHPERGLVPPDRFISIAESTGLIIEMGAWALRTACTVARQWHDQHGWPLKIAVNLSPRQFETGDLVATVCHALREAGCRPEWIELEITESLLLNDRVDTRTMLEKFHDMGLSIAIDDFGTGYSALSYLTRFPVDTLKIDRSFIRELTVDRDSAVLARAIVTLAHSLRMGVVAEGVETELQRDHLGAWGCEMVQGFFYSKPVPLLEFTTMVGQWSNQSLPVG
ncbi:MAG: EAL domain-containing protein [Burkholderiales bacterium]|nr:EAL domain-containing protein [Burkholderiales bacterium]